MYLFLLVLSVLLMYFHESKSHVSSWFCNRRRYKIFKPLKSDWKKKEIRFSGWSRGSMILRTTGSLRKNAQSLHILHLFVKRHQQTLLLHKIAIFRYIFLSADFWSGPELSLETFKWSTWLYDDWSWSGIRSIPSTERIRCFREVLHQKQESLRMEGRPGHFHGQELQAIAYNFPHAMPEFHN